MRARHWPHISAPSTQRLPHPSGHATHAQSQHLAALCRFLPPHDGHTLSGFGALPAHHTHLLPLTLFGLPHAQKRSDSFLRLPAQSAHLTAARAFLPPHDGHTLALGFRFSLRSRSQGWHIFACASFLPPHLGHTVGGNGAEHSISTRASSAFPRSSPLISRVTDPPSPSTLILRGNAPDRRRGATKPATVRRSTSGIRLTTAPARCAT